MSKLVALQLAQGENEEIRQLPTVAGWTLDNLRSSQSKGMETAWLFRSCGKNNTCCWRRYVARGDMLLEEIFCQRRYAAERYMFPKEICCRRRCHVIEGVWPTEISSQRRYLPQRRYLAKGGIWLMEVSSQRRYPAKGETHN